MSVIIILLNLVTIGLLVKTLSKGKDLALPTPVKELTADYRTSDSSNAYPALIEGIRERKQVQELKEKISTLEEELNGYKSAGRELELLDQLKRASNKLLLAGFSDSSKACYEEARRLHGLSSSR